MGRLLGEGEHYRVKEVINRETGCHQAVKIISKRRLQSDHTLCNQLHIENRILNALQHENIIRIRELVQDEDYYYQIMDRCQHGDLFQCVRAQQELGHCSITEE